MTLTENDIENVTLGWLSELGWNIGHGPDLAPEGKAPAPRQETSHHLRLCRYRYPYARQNG